MTRAVWCCHACRPQTCQPCSMMMRNVASQSYTWDQFCADPASFVDECLADPACSKCASVPCWLGADV